MRVVALTLVALALGGWAAASAREPADALTDLGLVDGASTPAVLLRPLWSDVPGPSLPADSRTRATLRVLAAAQRRGALRRILGPAPPRVVAVGALQDRERAVGTTALLALPRARRNVVAPGFRAAVLRDALVDVDLRRGVVAGMQPGPASRTTTWPRRHIAGAPSARVAASPAARLVRLSPGGPAFAPYDGGRSLARTDRDWPVSLLFVGHATVDKVKQALAGAGFTHVGEGRSLAYATPSGLRFDGDRGVKTGVDANGTDVHVRLYAPSGADHFTDPRFGDVVVATTHLDRGEPPAPGPRLFGFSEEAERRVAAAAAGLGWRVARDRLPLGNAEPFRRDLAAPDHVWWSDGRATLVHVP
jgi:hypothetical protein